MSAQWESRPGFRLLDALLEPELAALRALIGLHPTYRLYIEAGLAAARQGADRTVLFGRAGTGAVLGAGFDRIAIRTVIGTLAEDELLAAADIARAAELHLDDRQADFLIPVLGRRLMARRELRYYRLDGRPARPPDPRCRRLGPDDWALVDNFFGAYHRNTIFSRSMLDLPFLGLFEADELIACAGTVALAAGIANIGNFLTRPDRRGEGLAQAVAASLAATLVEEGAVTVTLGTNSDNPAACRAYEAVGFECFEARAQLDLGPAAAVAS
jgi:ribosomal protein S18 acetylase RimI-like enzyme